MNRPSSPLRLCLSFRFLIPFLALAIPLHAQQPARQLLTRSIDETKLLRLHGTVHPLSQPQFDRGPLPDSFPTGRVFLLLNRPDEREAALQQFLHEVHTPNSPTFHKWLTPEQFGNLFGASDADIQAAQLWLQSHGFQLARVTKNKTGVEFSGTAAQLREAFHTQLHQYIVNGETHYANADELQIPEALAPLVRGTSPINDFHPKPYVHNVGSASYSSATHKATPLWTDPNSQTDYFALAPEDFATQYNVKPLYQSGTDGTGQTIGIINESNVDIDIVNAYRQLFNLPANPPQVVIDGGSDPGDVLGVDVEAYLDVEVSGAVAPKATVNLYIGGALYANALRAVEDNQAAILSVSFGSCEAFLRNNGNQLWSDLWAQAAAQGQTVLVATGDSGSATCDPSGSFAAFDGLAVNGLASTPWNIAVGGTDFYYSDYKSGAPSAATLWNATNDSSYGSLKAPLPEQPWNNGLGLNADSYTTGVSSNNLLVLTRIAAAGGGASSCTQSTPSNTSFLPTCISGYPKPSWQKAPGMPQDSARDLPDVSLFAASGQNFSATPICAYSSQCVATAGSQPTVLLVGGTSVSTPTMAGIMALVTQKFGRQGQADYKLYALANQQPSVFHDITVGSNNVQCLSGSPNCSLDTNGDGFYTLQNYFATTGYDLASGIGSIDANALVTNWGSIKFLPTTTSLTISPTSFTHGTAVTLASTVTTTSGSGTPTGDITLVLSNGQTLLKTGALSLSNGSVSQSLSTLPGGTYQVTAQYSGDGTFGSSSSTPVTLTVSPEPSTVGEILESFGNVGFGVIQNGQQVPFGGEYLFQATPTGTGTTVTSGLATGTVTFTDGSSSATVAINSAGSALYYPSSLALGSHSVVASYSGDSSYNASTAPAVSFTVVKGTPACIVVPQGLTPILSSTIPIPPTISFIIPAGGNLTVSTEVRVSGNVAPTGTVTVTLGSATQTGTLSTASLRSIQVAAASVTFSNLQAGSYMLSASYSGDSNFNSANSFQTPITVAPSTKIATTTSVTAASSALSSTDVASFTINVQAASAASSAPFFSSTSNLTLFANGLPILGSIFRAPVPPATSASLKLTIPASLLPAGTSQITAVYTGDFNFNPSTSAPVSVTVTEADFSLNLLASQLAIKSGQSSTAQLNLPGVNGGTPSLTLTCTPSSSAFTCSLNPTTISAGPSSSATITVNAFVTQATAALHQDPSSRMARAFFGSGFAFAAAFLFVCSAKKKNYGTAFFVALLFVTLSVATACGGGPASFTSPPPPPTTTPTPAGTYTVVLSGSNGKTIHNTKLTIIVQ